MKFKIPKCYKTDPAKLKRRAAAEGKKRSKQDLDFLNEYAEELKKLEAQGHVVTPEQKKALADARQALLKQKQN